MSMSLPVSKSSNLFPLFAGYFSKPAFSFLCRSSGRKVERKDESILTKEEWHRRTVFSDMNIIGTMCEQVARSGTCEALSCASQKPFMDEAIVGRKGDVRGKIAVVKKLVDSDGDFKVQFKNGDDSEYLKADLFRRLQDALIVVFLMPSVFSEADSVNVV